MTTTYTPTDTILNNEGMLHCTPCGKEIHSTAAICPNCGASRRTSRYKNKVVAALFAFFLGSFGGHRFYLGQWWGIFYLLFFWLWIPGIVAFIEFIYFLLRDSNKWDSKYNDGIPAGANDKSSGVVISLLVIFGGFFFIAIIGIIASVALPAYQDYTLRAKVNVTWAELEPIKSKVETYYITEGQYPMSNADLGIQEPYIIGQSNTLTIIPDGVRIDFNEKNNALSSTTFIITPVEIGSSFTWSCKGGTLENRYRPSSCSK